MSVPKLRIISSVYGDVNASPGIRVKYGLLLEALAKRYSLVDVYDASLQGLSRILNALYAFHPDQKLWRERFYKSLPAFYARSRRLNAILRRKGGQADVVLQVGVLFDACWKPLPMPGVIYTDYTASLSARNVDYTLTPFTPRQRQRWIELEKGAFQHAVHICTRGELVRASVIEDYGIPAEKVTAIGGGLNFPALPEVVERSADRPPTVLFIGKELQRKGGDLLLQAFQQARAHVPDARLLFLSADAVPPDLPVQGVTLVPPTWDRQAIAALYTQADLFVLPSRLETWGDVLLEAMAYRLPCIGVSGQSMQEIIQDGVTGLVVPPNEVEALAEALVRLLSNPGVARGMGRAGRLRLEHNYTWDRVVERMAPVLETVRI